MAERYEKFSFDREYAADGTILRDNTGIKKILTIEEADAQAQAAAQAALHGEEAKAAHARADALRHIDGRLQILLSRLHQESESLRHEAVELALITAQVIADKALEQFGEESVRQCIEEALGDLRGEPRVTIRLNPIYVDALAPEIEQMAKHIGYEGAIHVRGDDDMAVGDCVLEWRNGAIERTRQDILTQIQGAAEKWLATPSSAPDHAEDPDFDQASGQ
ncbi:FliH/SctL family protein [Woodsholea maritima]|uniref:FliH/SctL family protein n=1 Tax=Woodsholea maritima TaxID=240237 RepID=UPI0003780F8E|nr:FliH/SctL family protein [Woodsholea maritima]